MSAGAVFKLIANDGKADRMIMATQLLNQRIKDVMCARAQSGQGNDTTPTLIDIERTHVLYVNAHFKPFAAIANEYNKVRISSGTLGFGGNVQFNIPQFGDFFHDMVIRTRLSQCSATPGFTPLQAAGSSALFPFNTSTSSGTAGTAGYVLTEHFYNIVDTAGTVIVPGTASSAATPVQYSNYVRYCEFPGNRLFTLVKFDVNGNPLDQYDDLVVTMLEKFCIPPNKRTGYNKMVGQEMPISGYGGLLNTTVVDADAAYTPAGITRNDILQSQSSVAVFAGNPTAVGSAISGATVLNQSIVGLNSSTTGQYDVCRQVKQWVNGAQTPKPVQPQFEMWNKLRFWFNDDVRLSIASVSIPFGQRFITVNLCLANALVFESPSIFLETTVSTQTIITAAVIYNGASSPVTQSAPAQISVAVSKTYTPIFQKQGITAPTISFMELYINNIFVNPEIHDIYIKRIGFSLIRVYRQHTQRVSTESNDEKLLSQLKWPIEYMFVGLRPVWNIKDTNNATHTDWHKFTKQITSTDHSSISKDTSLIKGSLSTIFTSLSSTSGNVQPDTYSLSVPTANSLTLTTHGINIYDAFSDTFFNQYLPFQYGGQLLNTPDDSGVLFLNMALFPRSYQPSGHLNVSRARETYIKWNSSYIGGQTAADMIVVAVAINFLLITDGSAVLRYST